MYFIAEHCNYFGSERLVYYSNERTASGEWIMTDITEAHAFETMKDACDFIIKSNGFYLGCEILNVADCTLEILKKEKETLQYNIWDRFHIAGCKYE